MRAISKERAPRFALGGEVTNALFESISVEEAEPDIAVPDS